MTLVQLDSALDALSNGVLGKARACSQQKLQSVQYSFTFYRHVRGLHIIISHIRTVFFTLLAFSGPSAITSRDNIRPMKSRISDTLTREHLKYAISLVECCHVMLLHLAPKEQAT